MGFETFNDPQMNVNLERVVREELSKPDKDKITKATESLEREENFAAIDENFGLSHDEERKDESEDILLEQKVKFRITNALSRLKELEGSADADSAVRVQELKKMLQESEDDLRKFYERTLN